MMIVIVFSAESLGKVRFFQVASEIRKRMVDGAMRLLARRGLDATSFSEVLAETGAPRGSIYHHFPEGKEQLIVAAVDQAGDLLLGALERCAGATAVEVVRHFLAIWRTVLTSSSCESGCAVLAVTVAADSAELLGHATTVFRAWRERLIALLQQGGLEPAAASRFAVMMIAATEGAVVLSRADRSMQPFEVVAEQLLDDVARTLKHNS